MLLDCEYVPFIPGYELKDVPFCCVTMYKLAEYSSLFAGVMGHENIKVSSEF